MPLAKPLTKERILQAMAATLSNSAAARYLHVSYIHYKRYAKMFKDQETGKSLFEVHMNRGGKGVPKFLKDQKKGPKLMDIIEGRIDSSHFTPDKIKYRMIEEGYLKEECKICGFSERRVLDFRIPLLLHFKDGNKKNYNLDNVELLCYNDYFLQIGDVFTKIDEMSIESPQELFNTTEKIKFEVSDYQLKMLKKLGYDEQSEDEIFTTK